VLDQYRNHTESKSLAPDGGPCRSATVGLLRRRPVTAQWVMHVGKESNRLEEVEAGLVHDPEEVYTEYVDARHDPAWATVTRVLKDMPRSRLMQETGLSRRALTALRNGHALPHAKTREALARAAAAFAREQRAQVANPVPYDDFAVCAYYLNEQGLGNSAALFVDSPIDERPKSLLQPTPESSVRSRSRTGQDNSFISTWRLMSTAPSSSLMPTTP
jgi:hypothetical protein